MYLGIVPGSGTAVNQSFHSSPSAAAVSKAGAGSGDIGSSLTSLRSSVTGSG